MRPRLVCEELHRFITSVGSQSDDCDKSRGSPIAINRDCYNSSDEPSRLNAI